MKKRILFITLAVIAIVFLCLHFFASSLIKNYIVRKSPEFIGRQIDIGNLNANIYSGRYEFENVVVYESDDSTSFANFDTIVLRTSLYKLLRNKVDFDEMTFVNLTINVEQNKDAFNFSDIVEFISKHSKESTATPSEEPVNISLKNITLKNGNINYLDKSISKEWQSGNIFIKIPGINFGATDNTDVGLTFNFIDGGMLSTHLLYDVKRQKYTLNLKLDTVSLKNALPYIQQKFNVNDVSGKMDASFDITGDLQHVLNFDINGKIKISNAEIVDKKNETLAQIKSINFDVNEINTTANRYGIGKLLVNGLDAFFELDKNGKSNFGNLFVDTSSNSIWDDINLTIKQLEIKNSSFNFADNTIGDDFKFGIDNINVVSNNFNTKTRNDARLNADLPTGGKLVLHWNGFLNSISNQTINAYINNFNLNEISAYSVKYFGYPVTSGIATISCQNTITNNNLAGTISIDIFNPKLEKKAKGAKPVFDVPLRTAIFMMKNKDNRIKLDFPVSGNINSPEFSYGKIISKNITNFFSRSLLSPFNSKSRQDETTVLFYMFLPDFTPAEYAKIPKIVELAKSKSEAKFEIVMYYNKQKVETQFAKAIKGKLYEPDNLSNDERIKNATNRYVDLMTKYLTREGLDKSRFVVKVADSEQLNNYKDDSKFIVIYNISNLE